MTKTMIMTLLLLGLAYLRAQETQNWWVSVELNSGSKIEGAVVNGLFVEKPAGSSGYEAIVTQELLLRLEMAREALPEK